MKQNKIQGKKTLKNSSRKSTRHIKCSASDKNRRTLEHSNVQVQDLANKEKIL